MYYVEHRIIGYVVYETENLEDARDLKKRYGRAFRVVDEHGNEVK